jgi:hypothetical protein
MKKIDKHEGSVKSIIWDPAGKYLASQVYSRIVETAQENNEFYAV